MSFPVNVLNMRLKGGVDEAVNCVMQVMSELDSIHGSGTGFDPLWFPGPLRGLVSGLLWDHLELI
jgi:hypothetical protein